MFDEIKAKFSKTQKFVDDEKLYYFFFFVSKEIQSGIKDEGVWAKAFTEVSGDEQKAKAKYIELMVNRLILAEKLSIEAGAKLKKQEAKIQENKKNWETREYLDQKEERDQKEELEDALRKSEERRQQAQRAERKKGNDKWVRRIRLPLSFLLITGSLLLSLSSYEVRQSIESFIFIPLAVLCAWGWWWYDVDS